MHFNSKKDNTVENYQHIAIHPDFLTIDTLKVDDHSRITFTKKIRDILPIQTGDEIAVFKSRKNENIIFNVQRRGSIVDVWICKRLTEDYNNNINNNNDGINDIYFDTHNILNRISPFSKLELGHQISNYNSIFDPKQNDIQKHSTNYSNINDVIITTNNNNNTKTNSMKHIMIIDDEPDIFLSSSSILNGIGLSVEIFANSADALLHFTETDPSYYGLVILDINMPGLNGLQLYKIMKAQRKGTKFLFVSALDYVEEFIGFLPEINANTILIKPIDTKYLVEKIKEIL
jgi:CheY-like chemotaxis protein